MNLDPLNILFFFSGIILIAIPVYVWMTSYSKNSNTPEEKKKEVGDKYSPEMNRYAARKEQKASVARSGALDALNTEQALIDANDAREHEAHLQWLRNETEAKRLETEREKLQAEKILTGMALDDGFTLENKQQHLFGEKLSETKVKEHKQIEQINLDNKLAEIQERVRLAIIAKFLSNEQIVTEIQTQIDKVYIQIDEANTNLKFSDETKKRMIADREEIITAFKAKRNERQAGLLEANNGGKIRGDDLDAEL